MTRRAFSPPDRTRQGFSTSSPEKPKHPARVRSAPWPACGNDAVQGLEDRLFAVQQVHGVLGEIAHPDAGADADRALVGRGGAGHQFQQRRLAGAVGAQHAPAFLAAHQEIEAFIDRLGAVALVDVAQADHVVARPRRAPELELDRLATARRLDAFDLVELLHPALDLGGVRGARLEPLDELDFLGQHGLLALVLRLALLFAERALLVVEIEIARIGDQRAGVDLHHLADDAVHERAVVRGHQQGAVIALEEGLQPDQAFQIEVVAGFVQQHAVGPHQQDAGQRHAHLPAAGQQADIAVHALLAEAQARQHLARPRIQRIAVQFLEAPLHLAIAFDDGVHARRPGPDRPWPPRAWPSRRPAR